MLRNADVRRDNTGADVRATACQLITLRRARRLPRLSSVFRGHESLSCLLDTKPRKWNRHPTFSMDHQVPSAGCQANNSGMG